MYDEYYKRIISASKNNSLTFFVGAGVSALSGAPSWYSLIKKFCDELGIDSDNLSSDDYLIIPQKYYYKIGENKEEYYEFIKNGLDVSSIKPNDIQSRLFLLNPVNIITTNFDNLLEYSAIENFCNYKSVACKEDVPKINGDKYILKIHGDLDHKNIVLKEEDYLNYSETFKLTETLLKAIFSTNTVVFIGYSLNDNNIKLILNWAKSLLDKSFNKPIFIYTDDNELSDIDLTYQTSRGLSVIDYHNCSPTSDDYFERYRCCLDKIFEHHAEFTVKATKYDKFNYIYECLKPLNLLDALRTSDLYIALGRQIYIGDGGLISETSKNGYFEYFVELNSNQKSLDDLPKETIAKYKTIFEVLKKARVSCIQMKNKDYQLNYEYLDGFADNNCLAFDYQKMKSYTEKEYKSLKKNYIKAYYFAKLCDYEKSFNLFKQVCKKAIEEKNYVVFYLARINLTQIYQAQNSINHHILYLDKYSHDGIDKKIIEEKQYEVFSSMPEEFKNEYSSLESLSTSSLLYENFYKSYLNHLKLKNTIDNSVIEFGQSSLNKCFFQINQNLNFYLANHLYLDEYTEFKNSIKLIYDTVIKKYAVQNDYHMDSHDMFEKLNDRSVELDEIDFYCFVEYFKRDELANLFNENNLRCIKFNNMELIEKSITNLMKFYSSISDSNKSYMLRNQLEVRLKTCMYLITKMKISNKCVDKIIRFMFDNTFREIDISTKVNTAYWTIKHNNINNNNLRQYLQDVLISYINQDIQCIGNGKRIELHSRTRTTYWDLTSVISLNTINYTSLKISSKIEQIIENKVTELYNTLPNYYPLVSKRIKTKITSLIINEIQNEPKWYQFFFLYKNDIKISHSNLEKLKEHLRKSINVKEDLNVEISPKKDPYENLKNVAFWCYDGFLNTNDFEEFYGINDKADFFFNPHSFDYSKFNIDWILESTDYACEKICKSDVVKSNINGIIKSFINGNSINKKDKNRLIDLYVKYFS